MDGGIEFMKVDGNEYESGLLYGVYGTVIRK